jgi:hypothetical protein
MNWRIIGLKVAVFLAACGVISAQRSPVTVSERLRTAQNFLHTLYPDLTSKTYWMSLTTSVRNDQQIDAFSDFEVDIGVAPKDLVLGYLGGYVGTTRPEDFHPGPVHPKQFLESGFQFVGNRIKVFNAQGPAVGNLEAENQFIDLVLSRPQMTDAEIAATLRDTGAKYSFGDKGELLRHLQLSRLEPFLGKLEVSAVSSPPLEENRSNLALWLTWVVNVTAEQPNGTKLKYKLTFEQFKGDLISLAETSSPTDKDN